jgi:diguanylate cyclase (GGDEF)-like protein
VATFINIETPPPTNKFSLSLLPKKVCFGAFIQLLFTLSTVLLEQSWLSIIGAASCLAWVANIVLAIKKKKDGVAYLSAVLIFIQIYTATLIFGIQAGAHLLFWPLACIFITNPRVGGLFSVIFAGLCFLAYIDLSLQTDNSLIALLSKGTNLQSWTSETAGESTYLYLSQILKLIVIILGGLFVIQSVIAMKNAFLASRSALDKMAHTDPLTGIANRRYFSQFIAKENQRAQANKQTFCVALGDVDHFKYINDSFGHDTGDIVLKELAKCFTNILSHNDVVCRWGGEEFIVFIPNADLQNAFLILEATREVISDKHISQHRITMSFGLVESNGEESVEQLISRADNLLYEAKSAGRNNIQL